MIALLIYELAVNMMEHEELAEENKMKLAILAEESKIERVLLL